MLSQNGTGQPLPPRIQRPANNMANMHRNLATVDSCRKRINAIAAKLKESDPWYIPFPSLLGMASNRL